MNEYELFAILKLTLMIAVILFVIINIFWLNKLYVIEGDLQTIQESENYCAGDIMEKETFRYQMKLITEGRSSTQLSSIMDNIKSFNTFVITMSSIGIAVTGIGILLGLYIQSKTVGNLPVDGYLFGLIVLIILNTVHLSTVQDNINIRVPSKSIFNNPEYNTAYSDLRTTLDNYLNKSYKNKDRGVDMRWISSLKDFPQDLWNSIVKRTLDSELLLQKEGEEIATTGYEKSIQLENELFIKDTNGVITRVDTDKLLPYLKLHGDAARKSIKDDINIIDDAYRVWACANTENESIEQGKNPVLVCKEESQKYITNTLSNINLYNKYDDIRGVLKNLKTIGWVFMLGILYIIHHMFYQDPIFRRNLILSVFVAIFILIMYYIMVIRNRH